VILLMAMLTADALGEEAAGPVAAELLVSRLVVEPLVRIGEDTERWIVPPGGTASSERFLCSIIFEVLAGTGRESGAVITEPVPAGLAYLPGSATGPGARIELSTDAGRTYLPEDQASAGEGAVTHVRWLLDGPLAVGMRGRVSFRARLAASSSTSIADR
jgi:hypothetical protein